MNLLLRLIGRAGLWLTGQDLRYRIDCYLTLPRETRR